MLYLVQKIQTMGQKIHPLGLRLGTTQNHRSKWFAIKNDYPFWFQEDLLIRKYLLKNYPTAKIVDIKIFRNQTQELPLQMVTSLTEEKIQKIEKETGVKIDKVMTRRNHVQVVIETPYISRILGDKEPKKQLKALSYKLVNLCETVREKAEQGNLFLKLAINPVNDPYNEASMIADDLIQQLEKRKSFRAALSQTLRQVKYTDRSIKFRIKQTKKKEKRLKRIRIQISGRLNGAEIARIEWRRKGRIPLHTLRADVGYAAKTAKTIHGILGIKVWTFTKEKF